MPQTTDKVPIELLAGVKVNDLRKPGVAASKREAAFGVPMGTVEFDPPEAQLIKQKLETELTNLLAEDGVQTKRFYVADLVEFCVNTKTTPLYWDVIGRIHIKINSGENQYDLFGTHTTRTYIWPGEEVIKQVINESLRQIANGLKPVAAGVAFKLETDSNISQRRSFRGFTITTPDGRNWIITKKDRTGIALLRKPDRNAKHSIVAFAKLKLVSPPLDSITSLKEFVEKAEKLGELDRRFDAYRYDIRTIRINGRDCVRSDFSAEDHGVPYDRRTSYMLEGLTVYCLHPESSSRGIVIGYSQRYEKGKTPLTLKGEMQQFVESLKFEHLGE